MNDSMSLNIVRIDHRNSICEFDRESLITFKDNLYSKLIELDDVDNKYIHHYLRKAYCLNSFDENKTGMDFVKMSTKFSQRILKSQINLTGDNTHDILETFTNGGRIRNNELIIDEQTVIDISSVLAKYYLNIDKRCKIRTEKEFMCLFNKFRYINQKCNDVDDCKFENSKTKIDLERRSTCSSLISMKDNELSNKNNHNSDFKRMSYYSKLKIPYLNSPVQSPNKKFKEGENENKKSEPFPKEFLLLHKLFLNVKSLKFVIENSEKKNTSLSLFYLTFLINIGWLFTNLNSISIDLQFTEFTNKFQPNLFTKDSLKNSKSLHKEMSDNKTIYELLILIPFYCSKYIDHLDSKSEFNLNLNIPDCYEIEIDFLFKMEKILINNFHLMDVFDFNSNLTNLSLNFNSLDSNSFKRIISLIHKLNNLKSLSLNLFSEDSFYSNNCLNKIVNLNGLKITSCKGNYFYCSNYNTNLSCLIDENENLLNALVTQFEENLEFLNFILSRKAHSLKSLKINFHIPNILCMNDKYTNVLHKFVLNLFMMLDSVSILNGFQTSLGIPSIENFEITSSNFTFNSSKYPYVLNKIDTIDLGENDNIKNIKLNFRFKGIKNVYILIPFNVENLYLNNLDDISFSSLVKLLKTNSNKFKNIKKLSIGLSHLFFKLTKDNIEIIYEFFRIKLCDCLSELKINLHKLPIDDVAITKILEIIKQSKNRINFYTLIVSPKNITQYRNLKEYYSFYQTYRASYLPLILLFKSRAKNRAGLHNLEHIIANVQNFLKEKFYKIINLELL